MRAVRAFKKLIKSIRSSLRFYWQCYLDSKHFRHTITTANADCIGATSRIESDIIRQYHVLEKGLCMPDFRPRFGRDNITGLINSLSLLAKDPDGASANSGQVQAACAVLQAYHQRHADLGIDVSDMLHESSRHLWKGDCDCSAGGVRPYVPPDATDSAAFERFARSRSSVRNFKFDIIPDRKIILEAVDVALRAPSVCNRQTARIHAYTGDAAQRALAIQSGNRGFGHKIPMVLVVTSDLRFFTGTVERYQGWIDGGMFAMLLLLALHAKGLGAVALNWSVNHTKDRALRKAVEIPDHERIIMLIGCGYPVRDCLVPISKRRSPIEITFWP